MNISGLLLSGMIGLFALAMGYVIVFVVYQRRMIAQDHEKQKLEIKHQKKLLQAVIESQEAERKRIAHDLHDEIGALLTTSRLYFNQLGLNSQEERTKMVSSKMNLLFDEMMINIRRISHDLRPVVLENLGLLDAIENFRHRLAETHVGFNFIHQLTFILAPEAELMLYRIIQELISNTLKHAGASRIDLLLDVKGDQLKLNYSDDGIGFLPSKNTTGLGLKSMESRLSLLGATMQINKIDRGVLFILCFPVHNLARHEKH